MFRRREGTGALYADNRRRAPRSTIRRTARVSGMTRDSNTQRPWQLESDADALSLDHVSIADLIEATRLAAGILLELLEDVGAHVQRCRRWRKLMSPAVIEDMGDLLDWYVVLFTVGVIDRQGVWLANRSLGSADVTTTRRP